MLASYPVCLAKIRAVVSLQPGPPEPPTRLGGDRARCTRRRSSSTTNSTYSRVRPTVSTVRKSHANMPLACARRNAAQLGPPRRGAGPSRWRRRIRRTDVADTRMPSLRHSPTIRISPQRGVLARHPHHQIHHLVSQAASGAPDRRIRPTPGHELAVPAQQRRERSEWDSLRSVMAAGCRRPSVNVAAGGCPCLYEWLYGAARAGDSHADRDGLGATPGRRPTLKPRIKCCCGRDAC